MVAALDRRGGLPVIGPDDAVIVRPRLAPLNVGQLARDAFLSEAAHGRVVLRCVVLVAPSSALAHLARSNGGEEREESTQTIIFIGTPLPLRLIAPTQPTQHNQQKKKRARHKAKILLADDNFDMREYVARLLSAKYEVISVSNGSLFRACVDYYPYLLVTNAYCGAGLEAVSVLRSNPLAVDLVLTDVMMPFLDGFGLLKEIRYCDRTRMAAHAPHTTLTRALIVHE